MSQDDQKLGSVVTLCACIFTAATVIVSVLSVQNPISQVIGIFFVVFTFLLVGFIVRKLRKFKRLIYRVVSDKIALNVQESEEIKGRVQIYLDNKPVRDAWIITLKIWNSGNLPIEPKDYHNHPIKINFREGAEVLEAKILRPSRKRAGSL